MKTSFQKFSNPILIFHFLPPKTPIIKSSFQKLRLGSGFSNLPTPSKKSDIKPYWIGLSLFRTIINKAVIKINLV